MILYGCHMIIIILIIIIIIIIIVIIIIIILEVWSNFSKFQVLILSFFGIFNLCPDVEQFQISSGQSHIKYGPPETPMWSKFISQICRLILWLRNAPESTHIRKIESAFSIGGWEEAWLGSSSSYWDDLDDCHYYESLWSTILRWCQWKFRENVNMQNNGPSEKIGGSRKLWKNMKII